MATSHGARFDCAFSPSGLLGLLQKLEFPRKLGVCERLFAAGLASRGTCWVRTAAGPVWKLDLSNATHRWIVYGFYEGPGFWRWLGSQRVAPRHIVDSGANIGQTLLTFCSLFPEASVWAYEPGLHARAWLAECVAANSWTRAHVLGEGLGAEAATRFLAPEGGADRHGSWNRIDDSRGEPIRIVRLDDELTAKGIATVDLWKLDMEGYEHQALLGASSALRDGRIRALHCEMGPAAATSRRLLESFGYRIAAIDRGGRLLRWTDHGRLESALFLAPGHPCHASLA